MKTCCLRITFKQSGLTLTELLISISVMAIILSMAIPSFQELITNSRLSSQTNNIVGALNAARSKAISTRYNTIIAPTSGTDWTSGFQVFLDKNTSGAFEDGTDEIVQKYDAPTGGITIKLDSDLSGITYQADGRAVAVSFYVCSPAEQDKAKQVIISQTGRVRTEPEATFAGNC